MIASSPVAAALALLVLLVPAIEARAAPQTPEIPDVSISPIVVFTEGCGALDSTEVGRLLELELRYVTAEIREGPPLQVNLVCDAERLEITVTDPLTRKRIERAIPAPPEQAGRERIVALAISQLYSASWLELLLPPPPAEIEPLEPPPPPSAVRAAKRTAIEETTPKRAYEVLLGAGVRGRSLESGEPFAASRVDALFRAWLAPSVAVVAFAGWDFGQTLRGLGQLRGHAIAAGGGLGWRYNPGQVAGVGGHILVGSGWARVAGRPSSNDARPGSISGPTGELMTGIGPRIRSGRFRLDVDFETGAMLRTPEAQVETRDPGGSIVFDEPVTLGGLWVGAVLRIGADLTRSEK